MMKAVAGHSEQGVGWVRPLGRAGVHCYPLKEEWVPGAGLPSAGRAAGAPRLVASQTRPRPFTQIPFQMQ